MTADKTHYLAFDLGAESGRAILRHFDGQRLELEEIHRFANGPVRVGDSLFWDVLSMWTEIKAGLRKASHLYSGEIASLGLDTWGVDYALLAADDQLIGNPYHCRNHRTDGMMEAVFRKAAREEIYATTGIQFMQLNTLYQMFAMVAANSPHLTMAKTFLTMPDLFNFWFTGRKANEFTITTTTQCYNPRSQDWAWELLHKLDIPTHIFQQIVPPGTVLDTLLPSVAAETGSQHIPVVAPACHDTGCAVASVPVANPDYIYLSSGTWSLMGIEVDEPIINTERLAYEITNEGGVGGKFRFLKNIMGMWLLQECRREWARQGMSYSYDDLTHLAAASPSFGPLVVPADSVFLAPGEMSSRIADFCRRTGQEPPHGEGAVARCIFESLAMEYRWVAERLEALRGRRLPTIHIIGGGSRNTLLNQLTANATNRTVVAGPVEATAIGNVLLQAQALGHLASLGEARAVVKRSFDVGDYHPKETEAWDDAYERYLRIRPSSPPAQTQGSSTDVPKTLTTHPK